MRSSNFVISKQILGCSNPTGVSDYLYRHPRLLVVNSALLPHFSTGNPRGGVKLPLNCTVNETQIHHQLDFPEPANSSRPASHPNKSLPPVLISGGLPSVPAKLAKRIQEGLFVEMAELLPEALSSLEYGTGDEPASQKQKPREVTNIVNWVQCFGIFIAIVSCKEANRITDLIGYHYLTGYRSDWLLLPDWLLIDSGQHSHVHFL